MTSLNVPVQMRFFDQDQYGHINNVTMLRYFEDARVRLTASPIKADAQHGIPEDTTFRESVGKNRTVVVHQSVDYKEQLFFRMDPVFVRTWISRIGGSSFTISYRLQEEDGSHVYAEGESVIVVMDPGTGRSVKLSEDHRALLGSLEDDVEYSHAQ
ncbi:acyl-CoA thioesterase [Kocuria sp. CPCC 205261]|uniref:acyl-CoA thioesterase n=1 Tax=Kocuria sp. CPCC 205261 TaxID=3073554 RepID=UPI0034D3D94F